MVEYRTVFERACRGLPVPHTPVWLMRQAGRYLPEYRELRRSVDFLTATRTPELAARITLQPMRRFELDAAILFSDIMTPLQGMGVDLDFNPGPIIHSPVRSAADAGRIRDLDPDDGVPFVMETIRQVRAELHSRAAVIGFAGAPFTLFCYLVQGSGSRDFMDARSFLRSAPGAAADLLLVLASSMGRYLVAQAKAGADALMFFDSWVGLLDEASYRRFVLPVMKPVIATIRAETGKPVIYFAHGGAMLLKSVAELGADVVGIDWTVPLSRAVDYLGVDAVVQGNLDPSALFAPLKELGREIDRVLEEGAAAGGHVFNLGHGIHRNTDPDRVAFLVDRVHEQSRRGVETPA